jgi:arsenate reductase (thioredoxin)
MESDSRPRRVLFVCIHNSARSQMAEGFLNAYGKGKFVAESAGIEAGVLNPLAVKAMAEEGIDISGHRAKTAIEMQKTGKAFDYIVTVCDSQTAEKCPFFPGKAERIHWDLPDPSSFAGTDGEKLAFTRKVRDEVKVKVQDFIGKKP